MAIHAAALVARLLGIPNGWLPVRLAIPGLASPGVVKLRVADLARGAALVQELANW